MVTKLIIFHVLYSVIFSSMDRQSESVSLFSPLTLKHDYITSVSVVKLYLHSQNFILNSGEEGYNDTLIDLLNVKVRRVSPERLLVVQQQNNNNTQYNANALKRNI